MLLSSDVRSKIYTDAMPRVYPSIPSIPTPPLCCAGRISLPLSFPSSIMSINSVPADILLDIADHLTRPAEVLHLYLTVCTYSIISHVAVLKNILVVQDRRRTHTSTLLPRHAPRYSPMRTYARYALRTPRPRTTRPFSQPKPGLLKWGNSSSSSSGISIQVGSQCPSRRIYGVSCGTACGEESRGIALVCVGRRGVTTVR